MTVGRAKVTISCRRKGLAFVDFLTGRPGFLALDADFRGVTCHNAATRAAFGAKLTKNPPATMGANINFVRLRTAALAAMRRSVP